MSAPVALVTGGSRGIGAATVEQLASAGYQVCLSYREDQAAGRASAESAQAAAVRAGHTAVTVHPAQADVTDEGEIIALFRECVERLGRPSIVINNAGIVADKARVDEMSASRLQQILQTNVFGLMLCCREAVRLMSTRHGGSGGAIVNVSSVASRLGSPGEYVDYAASKGAVDTFTLGLAKEVAAENIRVNAVRPGIIDTDIHASGGQPDRAQRLAPMIPMGRPGTAQEVAAAIVSLALPEAGYTTGALLDVAGAR